jgi:hypothetical protein
MKAKVTCKLKVRNKSSSSSNRALLPHRKTRRTKVSSKLKLVSNGSMQHMKNIEVKQREQQGNEAEREFQAEA